MDKQTERIIIRLSELLKNDFKRKAEINGMSISTRLKYLINLDINNKLKLKDEKL